MPWEVSHIDRHVQSLHATFNFLLDEIYSSNCERQEVLWSPRLLNSFLQKNLVVQADKDASQVVMSVSSYLRIKKIK